MIETIKKAARLIALFEPMTGTEMFTEPVVGLFATTQGVVYAVTGEPPGAYYKSGASPVMEAKGL